MEAIGTLASGIAHDFNNILQIISGYIQLMKARPEAPAGSGKYLDDIEPAVDRAIELVRQLLTFSRKGDQRTRPIDLNAEVTQTLKILERTIPKMVTITTRLADDLYTINADASQMDQVLMNLASNAVDAMSSHGELTVETENAKLDAEYCRANLGVEPGEYVLLRLSDNGRGMDQGTLAHIFEPFFTTKGVGEGTGLGLSTVYGIVKGHGGHIRCESEPGTGTVFSIYLPALGDVAPGNGLEAGDQVEMPQGDETILLVDDEQAILDIGRDILERHGYKVITAENGETALEIYRRSDGNIDLVILDLGMPGMGGHSCLGEILRINPEAKAVIASGYSINGRAKMTVELGAGGFISKPYSLVEMLRKIRQVLDS